MNEEKKHVDLMDESDRGAVLVGAAILEDELSRLIEMIAKVNGLFAKDAEKLFSMNGPASTFSGKSLVCRAFGLISQSTFEDLNRIRKLRNKFAHTSEPVDFLMPEIEDIIADIQCCIEASKGFSGEMFKGRGKIIGPPEPRPPDYELRTKGFVKYSKSVFCLDISLLKIKILNEGAQKLARIGS